MGRADGVLNPSGIRFGSAEIYNVIEAHFRNIVDSLCVGRRRKQDEDEAVMLFLKMSNEKDFNDELVKKVKAAIRRELSSRHVPKFVFATPDIPVSVKPDVKWRSTWVLFADVNS